jgi:hypothetical protein
MERDGKGKPASKVVFKEYGEYEIPEWQGIAFENLMIDLSVAGAN